MNEPKSAPKGGNKKMRQIGSDDKK